MSLKLNSSGGGSVTLQEPTTASDFTLTLPAQTATVITDSSAILNIGSGQIYKDASGNVGVGTSSPSSFAGLTVFKYISGGGQNYSVRFSDAINSTFWVGHQSGLTNLITDTAMGFYTLSTERARIDTSGNWYMNSGYGSVAVAYGCRAWVRYDGNAQSLIASGNVSSVTYTGTGNYYVNLSTAMPDANYSISLGRCTLNSTQPGADGTLMVGLSSATANWIGTADQATTGFRLRFGTSGSSFFNTSYVSAAIFR